MVAAGEALKRPSQKYLLHIDEINRADLGKVLGEALFLLEPEPESPREIDLLYDFGEPFHESLHNPNLAVVCDADQIIYAHLDKKAGKAVTYTSGAIENPVINHMVIDVLEGTRPAFDNRDAKYQDDVGA